MFSQGEGEVGCKNGFVNFEFLYFHFLWEDTLWGQFWRLEFSRGVNLCFRGKRYTIVISGTLH
jgi:hypothetical protein